MVEYILLVAVLASLAMTVLKSDAFNNLFGPNSEVFTRMRDYMEYTYRHGASSENLVDNSNYAGAHDTNYNDGDGSFLSLAEHYP